MKRRQAKEKPVYLYEKFPFKLPDHNQPEIPIKPTTATPLDDKEEFNRAMEVYYSQPYKSNVVAASADAEKALTTLAKLARDGDGKALWQFASIISQSVEALNEIAQKSPEALVPYASQIPRWPMMRSLAPLLCDNDELLKKLKVGSATGFEIHKGSKWKPDYAAVVAAALMRHIDEIRRNGEFLDVKLGERCKAKFRSPLLPFSKKSKAAIPGWWPIAKEFLHAACPRPEEIIELDTLVTSESGRRYPSTRRRAILEMIKARFMALAPVS